MYDYKDGNYSCTRDCFLLRRVVVVFILIIVAFAYLIKSFKKQFPRQSGIGSDHRECPAPGGKPEPNRAQLRRIKNVDLIGRWWWVWLRSPPDTKKKTITRKKRWQRRAKISKLCLKIWRPSSRKKRGLSGRDRERISRWLISAYQRDRWWR